MAFIPIKISILVIISILICVLNANSIRSDSSDGRNKMSLSIQEPNDEDVISDYNPLSNQAIYIDKIGSLIGPKRRIGANLGALSSGQWPAYDRQQKRQIRYHQCYFNPISCFRRRK